jgi:hypothetical protein
VIPGGALFLCAACNSGVPEPASVEMASGKLRLTITRIATDPFLSRHNLKLSVGGAGGCTASAELFPDTGYASRRNVYMAPDGSVYVVGQFDARVVDAEHCTITLSEFRHLQRDVTFLGSFDEQAGGGWAFFSPSERREQPFEKR